MQISMIVAYSQNRVIGDQGTIPWHIPSDFKHFKQTTLHCPIIMGRKTWESLPKALPQRPNIVISRQLQYSAPSATVVHSLEAAVQLVSLSPEIFIIGGAALYAEAMPYCHRLIATEIDIKLAGDTFFPTLPPHWQERSRQPKVSDNGLTYQIVEYINPQVQSIIAV